MRPLPSGLAGPFPESDVLAAAAGDAQAYGRLVEASKSTVCSIALAIVRNVGESEDVAQEAFLEAWKGLSRLSNPASFLPWLRQLTRNRARNFLRSRVRRRNRTRAVEDEVLEAAVDPSPGVVESLQEREREELLTRVLDELPDEAREVITLFYREGRSAGQVAELLGLSEAAVRQRLSRARRKVRREVLDRAGEGLSATAPGTAFSAAVATAVTAALPAASAFGAGALSGGASAKMGGSLLGKAGAVLAAFLLPTGLLIGVNELNLRRLQAGSLDEEEVRGFRKLRRVSLAACLLIGISFPLSFELVPRYWWAPVLVFGLLIAYLATTTFAWIPRLTARRFAEEVRRDPAAARRHRRQRTLCLLGFWSGLICGGLGLAYGLLSAIASGG